QAGAAGRQPAGGRRAPSAGLNRIRLHCSASANPAVALARRRVRFQGFTLNPGFPASGMPLAALVTIAPGSNGLDGQESIGFTGRTGCRPTLPPTALTRLVY